MHRYFCNFDNRPRFMVFYVDCVVIEPCQKLGFCWVEFDVDVFRYVSNVTVLYWFKVRNSRCRLHCLRISYKCFAGMTADARQLDDGGLGRAAKTWFDGTGILSLSGAMSKLQQITNLWASLATKAHPESKNFSQRVVTSSARHTIASGQHNSCGILCLRRLQYSNTGLDVS